MEGTRIVKLGDGSTIKDVQILSKKETVTFQDAFGKYSNASGNPIATNKNKNAKQSVVDPKAGLKKSALQNSFELVRKAKEILSKAKSLKNDNQLKSIKSEIVNHKQLINNHLSNISKIGIKSGFDGFSNAQGDTTTNSYGTTVDNGDGTFTTTDSNGNSISTNSDGSPMTPQSTNTSSNQNTITDSSGNTTYADFNSDTNKSQKTIDDNNNVSSLQAQIQNLNNQIILINQNTFDLGQSLNAPGHRGRITDNNAKVAANNSAITSLNAQLATAIITLAGDIAQDYTNWKTAQDIQTLQADIDTLNQDVQNAQSTADQAQSDANTAQDLANQAQASATAATNAIASTTTPAATPVSTVTNPDGSTTTTNSNGQAITTPVGVSTSNLGTPVSTVTNPDGSTTTTYSTGATVKTPIANIALPTTPVPVDQLTGQPVSQTGNYQSGTLDNAPVQQQTAMDDYQSNQSDLGTQSGDGSDMTDGNDGSEEEFDMSSDFDGKANNQFKPTDFQGFDENNFEVEYENAEGVSVQASKPVAKLVAEIGVTKAKYDDLQWRIELAKERPQVSDPNALSKLEEEADKTLAKLNALNKLLNNYKNAPIQAGAPDANRLLEVGTVKSHIITIASAKKKARLQEVKRINYAKNKARNIAPLADESEAWNSNHTRVVEINPITNKVVEFTSNATGETPKASKKIDWKVVAISAGVALVGIFAYNKLKKK